MNTPLATQKETAWYSIEEIDKIDSPCLVIYLDRVKENIWLLKGMIDDVQRLRPHVKTHKVKEVALMLIAAGIQKFKCATIAEAEMLGSAGAADVLLAYQPVGPKTDRFISLIKEYPVTQFSCMVDNEIAAQAIAERATLAKLNIPVFIDVNVGMNRTGIAPENAVELYQQSARLKGIQPIGLHAYDGHIRNKDLAQRRKECDVVFAPVEEAKQTLAASGFKTPIIVAGGSPTFPIHAQRSGVECSPGTFIYWDAGYEAVLTEQPFLTAALVVSRIVSLPTATTICLDLGHKSVATENELNRRVKFLNAPSLKFIGQSEEHLVAETDGEHDFKIGEVLYGLPFHICPTCALYERAMVVQNGRIAGEWKIVARDRRITI